MESEMTLAAANGMRPCGVCGVMTDDWYVADNNGSGLEIMYCAKCEEERSERYGCALLLHEGAMCEDGACGCGGTGVY
jgi:hypothetical protein